MGRGGYARQGGSVSLKVVYKVSSFLQDGDLRKKALRSMRRATRYRTQPYCPTTDAVRVTKKKTKTQDKGVPKSFLPGKDSRARMKTLFGRQSTRKGVLTCQRGFCCSRPLVQLSWCRPRKVDRCVLAHELSTGVGFHSPSARETFRTPLPPKHPPSLDGRRGNFPWEFSMGSPHLLPAALPVGCTSARSRASLSPAAALPPRLPSPPESWPGRSPPSPRACHRSGLPTGFRVLQEAKTEQARVGGRYHEVCKHKPF